MTDGRVTVREDVVFGTGGGRELRCNVYIPPGGPVDVPGVLLLHGGSWRSGDRSQLRGYGILIGREGFVCVASEYRLTPESPWPAQIEDVKAALRWMRANASELGIDAAKIVVQGNSAGAHLALHAAGTANRPEFEGTGGNAGVPTDVAAAIGVYPPTLFHAGPETQRGSLPLLSLTAGDDGVARAASPVHYAAAGFPPTLLIHGTADQTVPPSASIVMYEALQKAGVPVELHMYAGQPHAFDTRREFGRQTAAIMTLFLDRYVRSPENWVVTPRTPRAT